MRDPYELEEFVGDLWSERGCTVNVTQRGRDRGIDVEAIHDQSQLTEFIQVKCYSSSNKVGSPEVQQYASLYQRRTDPVKVTIVTTGEFTGPARQEAQELSVEIYNGSRLYHLVKSYGNNDFYRKWGLSSAASSSRSPLTSKNMISSKSKGSSDGSSPEYTSSTPWRKECPFCSQSVHYSEKALIQHWTFSSMCNFSKTKPKDIPVLNSNWDEIIEKIEAKRERKRSEPDPHSKCPYCSAKLKLRSSSAYLEHWTDGSYEERITSLPDERPTVVPVDVWWEIKDEWPAYESRVDEYPTSTRTSVVSLGNRSLEMIYRFFF
ncbi:restriction endonuclease [Natronococcus amylolyticus]|nr:restriction endonuclease [Natronococcus amylolyticus]